MSATADRWRTFVHLPLGCVLGTLLLLGTACGITLPKSDAIEISVDQEQVKQILRAIFPDLSEDELSDYSSKLDLKAAIALEVELSGIRGVAEGLSKELTDLADQASAQRQTDLDLRNGGYPTELEPLGRRAFYDSTKQQGRIELSGARYRSRPRTGK